MKQKLMVVCGGQSSEHIVSRMSCTSVMNNLNKENYDVTLVGIDQDGSWYILNQNQEDLAKDIWLDNAKALQDVFGLLKQQDVVLPILHGAFGEDGTIQGLFELAGVPYVGCRVLASAVSMDKIYTKKILETAGIPQVKSLYVKKRYDGKLVVVNKQFDEIEDIEKTVYAYVQSQIDEYGLDAEIVDVVVSGSRCRGIEKENSDLDVVVEYTGSTREDDLFNMLHEDSIYIAGIQVDINPITEGKTGTLETYLPEVETYLQEKAQQEQINNQLVTQGREVVQEQNTLASEGKVLSELEKEPVIEPETVHITFTVAECGEIHSMGEFHEGIETVEEAMKLYNAIDPSRMQGIPSIGVNMHIEGTEEWEDEQADIVSGKRIDVDFLNYTPELRDTPKVQDAIKKLIAAYPEKDVIDMETKEQKIQTLAAELDQLSYDIDTFEYRDSVPDREAQIQMIANDIRSGNVKPLQIFLQTSIDEGIDEDSERQAKELIAKLAEYKPLAKIEELEEQNYNMIDDRLNNGVEKFNREEEKKEQAEKPQARTSLKERLAAKQTEVAQGKKDSKEQEKSKNTHREM